jgi:hypothetical protein
MIDDNESTTEIVLTSTTKMQHSANATHNRHEEINVTTTPMATTMYNTNDNKMHERQR